MQVPVHAPGDLMPFARRRDHERAAIVGADLARDRSRAPQADRECSSASSACARGRDAARRSSPAPDAREQRQDVRLALRQAVVTQVGQVEADPVRRSMNGWNQTQ